MKKLLFLICMIGLYSCKCGQGNSQDCNSTPTTETEMLQLASNDVLDKGDIIIGEYQISYILSYNDIVAHVIPETIKVNPGTSREVRNKSLFLTVRYNDEIILDNKEIRSTCFEEIEDADKFIIGPQNLVHENWFKVVNDTLVVEFGAFVQDTDWGYWITLFIDKNGQLSSMVVNNDDIYFE